jgi:hypothetical protein
MSRPLLVAFVLVTLATPALAATPGVQPVAVAPAGRIVDTSHPNRYVGTGTPASCTSAAVVAAIRAGGIIRFRCGSAPITIVMRETAKVLNTRRHRRAGQGDTERWRGPSHPLYEHL